MIRPSRKPIALALAVLACIALAACGKAHTPVTEGDNTGAGGVNASYLDLGGLRYQVQQSRTLNPSQDGAYLVALPPKESLTPGQLWFGVFVLVKNTSKEAAAATNDFSLTDTQGNVYRPIVLGPGNPFRYHPQTVAPDNQLPPLGTPAAQSPTQSSLLLFKLPTSMYDNRPLVLHISDPATGKTVNVTLDV